ncbi:hypothetical protein GW13_PRO3277 [Salmonella enterica subsp. enterica serovar Cerro]|nr:hypothetical protein GW13_PRO3277 [Salmonella enterica subsp. enterica serovar Cerro]
MGRDKADIPAASFFLRSSINRDWLAGHSELMIFTLAPFNNWVYHSHL